MTAFLNHTHLPAFVMIISVPASWNFFHSSFSWRTTFMFSMFWKTQSRELSWGPEFSYKHWLICSWNREILILLVLSCFHHLVIKHYLLNCSSCGYLVGPWGAGGPGSCGRAELLLLLKEICLASGLDLAHPFIRHSWSLLLQHLCRITEILSCQTFSAQRLKPDSSLSASPLPVPVYPSYPPKPTTSTSSVLRLWREIYFCSQSSTTEVSEYKLWEKNKSDHHPTNMWVSVWMWTLRCRNNIKLTCYFQNRICFIWSNG